MIPHTPHNPNHANIACIVERRLPQHGNGGNDGGITSVSGSSFYVGWFSTWPGTGSACDTNDVGWGVAKRCWLCIASSSRIVQDHRVAVNPYASPKTPIDQCSKWSEIDTAMVHRLSHTNYQTEYVCRCECPRLGLNHLPLSLNRMCSPWVSDLSWVQLYLCVFSTTAAHMFLQGFPFYFMCVACRGPLFYIYDNSFSVRSFTSKMCVVSGEAADA